MDDVLRLIMVLRDVLSRNQPGATLAPLGGDFLRAKTKWPPDISRSNIIFQQMKPGTSEIPHFYVILTGQSISCITFMTQGHL